MKKYLMSFLTLVVFSFIFSLTTANFTQVKAAECTTDKLIVHYLRFDGNYDNVGLFTWAGGNTAGSDGLLTKDSVDDFGAVITVCIGEAGGAATTTEGVTKYTVEIIPTTDVTETNGAWHAAKDSYKGNNVKVDITELKKVEVTEQHVYIVEGVETPLYPDTTKGNAIVVYFDATQDYKDWGIHTWSNDGPAVDWASPIPFAGVSYYKGVDTSKLMTAAIPVGANASDNIGFIVHKGDTKKYSGDINLDVTGIKGSGVKVFYYIAGDQAPVSAQDFVNNAFVFKFVPINLEKLTGTFAPNPEVIRVELNQDITIKKDNVVVFDPEFFTLKEGETELDITIKYNEAALTTRTFSISFEEGFKLDPTKTYTLSFDNQDPDPDKRLQAEVEVSLDKEAPVFTFTDGTTEFTVTQGNEFTFPEYYVTDNRDGIITNKAYVPEGKGFLDTGVLGAQKITLTVSDTWGNETELEITVNVVAAPKSNLALIIGLSVGGVVVLGAAGFFVLKKFSK